MTRRFCRIMIGPAALCGLNVVPGRAHCRFHAYRGAYTDTARQMKDLAARRHGAAILREAVTELRIRIWIGAYRMDEAGQGSLDALLDSIS